MVRHIVTGSKEEIQAQWKDYVKRFPNLHYGTHVEKKGDNFIEILRFDTIEDCQKACIHEVSEDPLGKKSKEV